MKKSLSRIILFLVLFVSSAPLLFAEVVNINSADEAALAHYLDGIGPSKAHAIVEYRSKRGAFKSVDDLVNVPGIGDKTLAAIRANVSTSEGQSSVVEKTEKK